MRSNQLSYLAIVYKNFLKTLPPGPPAGIMTLPDSLPVGFRVPSCFRGANIQLFSKSGNLLKK